MKTCVKLRKTFVTTWTQLSRLESLLLRKVICLRNFLVQNVQLRVATWTAFAAQLTNITQTVDLCKTRTVGKWDCIMINVKAVGCWNCRLAEIEQKVRAAKNLYGSLSTVKMQWLYKLIKDNIIQTINIKLGTIVVPKNTELVTSTNATTLSDVKYCAQTVNTQHDELNKFR